MNNIDDLNRLPIPGVYKYKHLPQLAKMILDNHLLAFCTEQLAYAREYKVPLLKLLAHLTEPELIELSLKSIRELLEYLIANNAEEQIQNATERWMSNQLDVIGKYDVLAEDITLISCQG